MSNRALTLLLVGSLLCGLPGCGGGDGHATGSTRPSSCTVGESALPFLPEAPAWWTEGPGPTLALACVHSRAAGEAMIVGYASPESTGGHCMSTYNLTLRWSVGEKCAAPGVPWTYWCEGAEGCVKGFGHDRDVTGLMGLLSARVKAVRVLVGGRPLKEGVGFAHVHGRTLRLVGAEEPFAFFVAYVPRCVEPREVKVEMLDGSGSRIGDARGFDSPAGCPKRG